MLVDDGVDVIIADDGLQHRRLQRDFEICVIDSTRGLGNGRLLPAGPLRESPQRLRHFDQVLLNGQPPQDTANLSNNEFLSNNELDAIIFELVASDASRLNGSETRPLSEFADTTVHAVAAIGNPGRFFDLLRAHRIQVIEHSFPDHARLRKSDLQFGDSFEILMTEKDAVKLSRSLPDKFWYVPVELVMDDALSSSLLEKIDSRLRTGDDLR